jgi:hypothetical protein
LERGRIVALIPQSNFASKPKTHTQENCALWASQPQKSVTLRPKSGGETTKSIRDMWWYWHKKTQKMHIIHRVLPYTGTRFMFFHYVSPDVAIYASSQSSDDAISGEESAAFLLSDYVPRLAYSFTFRKLIIMR